MISRTGHIIDTKTDVASSKLLPLGTHPSFRVLCTNLPLCTKVVFACFDRGSYRSLIQPNGERRVSFHQAAQEGSLTPVLAQPHRGSRPCRSARVCRRANLRCRGRRCIWVPSYTSQTASANMAPPGAEKSLTERRRDVRVRGSRRNGRPRRLLPVEATSSIIALLEKWGA